MAQEKLKTMLMQTFGVTNKEHNMVCNGIFWSRQFSLVQAVYWQTCQDKRTIYTLLLSKLSK